MFFDNRLGNVDEWHWNEPDDWHMRVPTHILKSVGFFARLLPKGEIEERRFRGTGFFVSLPSNLSGCRHHVIVTARHVAAQLALGGSWVMRLNKKDSGYIDIRSNSNHHWHFHPTDDTVDAAVSSLVVPPGVDYDAVQIENFADDTNFQDESIGPGDEVFTVGLFTKMTPHEENRPIVRTGNISLVPAPGEVIPGVNIGTKAAPRIVNAEVYLIEARSIGGLSGSPVFVRSTVRLTLPVRRKGIAHPEVCRFPGQSFFLGLAQGHWDVPLGEMNDASLIDRSEKQETVNMGISIVVPAKQIRDIIYCQELVDFRRDGKTNTRDPRALQRRTKLI